MISETSPTLIFEACYPQHTDLIRQVWAAAHAHGVKMTEQAHAWLDEPEFVLTELLRVPLWNDLPTPAAKLLLPFELSKYAYHYWECRKMLNGRNKAGKYSEVNYEVIELYRPDRDLRNRAVMRK